MAILIFHIIPDCYRDMIAQITGQRNPWLLLSSASWVVVKQVTNDKSYQQINKAGIYYSVTSITPRDRSTYQVLQINQYVSNSRNSLFTSRYSIVDIAVVKIPPSTVSSGWFREERNPSVNKVSTDTGRMSHWNVKPDARHWLSYES